MSISSRSAIAIHALMKLARSTEYPLTSTEIADSLRSNPVLVRRILGSLREAGLVSSTEGRGGGWTLARASRDITLYDTYAAVEVGPILSRHPHPPSPQCEVGRHIEALLEAEFRDAERGLEQRLGRTTIDHLVRQMLARERDLKLSPKSASAGKT